MLGETTPSTTAAAIPLSRSADGDAPERVAASAERVAASTPVAAPASVPDGLLRRSRQLLEHIAVAAPLPDQLAALVRLIEEQSSAGLIGSVLLADPDGRHLRSGAAPSLPDWYNRAVDGIEVGPCAGSCGTAAYRREVVVVADIETDSLWDAFRDLAREAGLRACWSTPLLSAGELMGTFAMYYPQPRVPSDEDREVARTFARTATLVIERHRQEEVRRAAVAAEAEHVRRMSRLAEVSLELASADTLDDLVRVVIGKGIAVLGADGGAVTVRDDEHGVVRLSVSAELDDRVPVEYAQIPLSSRIPGAYVACTGETVLFPTRSTGLAWSDEMIPVYEATERDAWATLPLVVGSRVLGALVISWIDERTFDASDHELMQVLAAQCGQSLHRIRTRAAELDAAEAAQRMSEAFQRSLLTRPPHPDDVTLAVRYLPAVEQAQVGGDWYDAFTTAAGATTLVVGDVNGHDRDAAAGMGQIRNILRGLAYDVVQSPAQLLGRLDAALHGLQLNIMATAVLVQTAPGIVLSDGRAAVPLRWSNAGHLPPLLRYADGSVEVLWTEPDLLLGLLPDADRQNGRADLPDGATFLLYTDGLVERRGEDLDVGISRLADALTELGTLPLEQLCNALVDRLCPIGDDDIALLAVRPQSVTPVVGAPARSGSVEGRHLAVAADPAAVGEARQFVAEVCDAAAVQGDLGDTAILLTSELVTNAVLHARSPAYLTVWADGSRLRVQVTDESRDLPKPNQADENATGGRGISMVALLASRWGVELRESGKSVWFELLG
ncbi:MAG TPA: SpoIIE family protein phosphatase [Frankiaceae bacterium]|nr:SpoIIE family protein phosphatase [Frankiaceae bacterium]